MNEINIWIVKNKSARSYAGFEKSEVVGNCINFYTFYDIHEKSLTLEFINNETAEKAFYGLLKAMSCSDTNYLIIDLDSFNGEVIEYD